MNRFKASKLRHTEARLPRREAWIGGLRAGSVASCGNHVKASCHWVAFSAETTGVLGIVPLEGTKDGGKRTVSQLCCHSDVVTDFDFSPFDQLLLATGSADETVKVWRLPEGGQDLPSSAGLTLGPGGGPVDVLQFHPTADGVLASGAGKRVTVWDVGQQQPLAALEPHGDQLQSLSWKRDGRLLGTSCKDKKLRSFDPRASPAASQQAAHFPPLPAEPDWVRRGALAGARFAKRNMHLRRRCREAQHRSRNPVQLRFDEDV